ncbi:Krueppel-like factor, partial [Lachnellula suecica]
FQTTAKTTQSAVQSVSLIASETNTCNHPGCSNSQIFKQKSAYRKHMDKHQRPYKCTKASCSANEFGSMGDLRRHQRTIHGVRAFICTVPSCKRRGKAFGRKDNLSEHLKRVHGMGQQPNLASSDLQPGMAMKGGDHGSPEEIDEQSVVGDKDKGSCERGFEEANAGPLDKASLTAKLLEMERDVAALKRVLAFM